MIAFTILSHVYLIICFYLFNIEFKTVLSCQTFTKDMFPNSKYSCHRPWPVVIPGSHYSGKLGNMCLLSSLLFRKKLLSWLITAVPIAIMKEESQNEIE